MWLHGRKALGSARNRHVFLNFLAKMSRVLHIKIIDKTSLHAFIGCWGKVLFYKFDNKLFTQQLTINMNIFFSFLCIAANNVKQMWNAQFLSLYFTFSLSLMLFHSTQAKTNPHRAILTTQWLFFIQQHNLLAHYPQGLWGRLIQIRA